jgi:group I intron endonuclease
MGSGKIIKRAIKKHGKENFTKEIIADYPTRKEASDHEKRVVTSELIKLDECYNCRNGGDNENFHSDYVRKKISNSCSGTKHKNWGKHLNEETKNKISESQKGEKNHRFGKKNTPEHQAALLSSPRFTRKCMIEGIIFNSIKEASEFHNVKPPYVCKKLKSTFIKWLNWSYIDTETMLPLKTVEHCRTRSDFNFRKEIPIEEIERNRLSIRRNKNSDEKLERTYIPPVMTNRCRTISIDNQVFTSIKEATYILKITDVTIRNRCKSMHEKWKNWMYL